MNDGSDYGKKRIVSAREIAFTALFMALNIVLGLFPVPVGVATLYLTDVAICIAGMVLSPFFAFVAGGVGAFIGDLLFYPKAMIVTLITRSVQVVVISVFSRYVFRKKPFIGSLIGCLIGALIMITGYSFVGAFVYGNLATVSETFSYALTKVPLESAQAFLGVVFALPLCYKFNLRAEAERLMEKAESTDKVRAEAESLMEKTESTDKDGNEEDKGWNVKK